MTAGARHNQSPHTPHMTAGAWHRRSWLVVVIGSVLATVFVHAPASAEVGTLDGPAACCVQAERLDPPEPPRRAESVGLIGDSLTVGLTDDRFQNGPTIQAAVASTGRSMWFVTTVSMTLSRGRDTLASRRSTVVATDLLVIALGTNDIVGTGDPNVLRAAIDRIVDEARGSNPDVHIVWVDLAFPRLASRAATFNGLLDDIEAGDPAFHRCPWSEAIAANPGWFAGDRIHHTGAGYAARRDVVVGCIDAVAITD